ncbi:hypothetical protein Csac_1234 [Caldicellulosiruptor saccharolyticus DSM 8903]|uniref:Peptidase C39-like domain-containing protein n=1 Tax=Caldicellulosiruptor saccharolyticus (strain ATCC 43494 / DSM 8903 / Tp8T 6331) TaxID=351627 RepID=A4XIV2_CALS8|nr:papain-like cysteine protease family protein [Caldicellulosiruptor saccharolyticus]ABP66837.1 hypothetical protein Csac_1234 [Caldicellulosiruptor saccharolyticus DSM 8903]
MVKKLLKKGRYKRIVISAIVFLTLLLLNLSDAFAENTVTYVELPVKKVRQAYSNWCWAAGCESILYYCKNYLGFGREATQWDIVKYIYGSYVNQGATLSDIQRALSYYGVGSSRMYPISGNTITYGQICEQIVSLRSPIGINVVVGAGHFAVLCGIWQYFDNGSLKNFVLVMDPAVGYIRTIPDSELRDNDFDWELIEAIKVYRP